MLSSIPRLGVLWCPNWAVVAAGAAADEPVVVLHANRVIATSLAAGREGIDRKSTRLNSSHR